MRALTCDKLGKELLKYACVRGVRRDFGHMTSKASIEKLGESLVVVFVPIRPELAPFSVDRLGNQLEAFQSKVSRPWEREEL